LIREVTSYAKNNVSAKLIPNSDSKIDLRLIIDLLSNHFMELLNIFQKFYLILFGSFTHCVSMHLHKINTDFIEKQILSSCQQLLISFEAYCILSNFNLPYCELKSDNQICTRFVIKKN
jgi:hypothetical protein